MDKFQAQQFHNEVNAALRPICDKFGLDYQGGTLTYGSDGIRIPIKANTKVTITTALTADTNMIRAGFARPGTKAIVFDSKETHSNREVILVEAKRTKYLFYFANDPQKRKMLGHFSLFSSTN